MLHANQLASSRPNRSVQTSVTTRPDTRPPRRSGLVFERRRWPSFHPAPTVIGAFVRGLSMRDVESLCEEAGLGSVSKSTAARICSELRERFEQFYRRDLYDIKLVALFLDATFLAVRRDGPKEGVQVAWGFTEDGERVLLAVMLGMRESYEDWQALGRDLIGRGLGAPMLIVADGAPGLNKAIEQCWPASDRQRCCVHRARNLYAKLPDRERERVKHAYWRA
ncbi:MAG: IS256 family transposase, partial [Solirubrobacteraceae bacterium]